MFGGNGDVGEAGEAFKHTTAFGAGRLGDVLGKAMAALPCRVPSCSFVHLRMIAAMLIANAVVLIASAYAA